MLKRKSQKREKTGYLISDKPRVQMLKTIVLDGLLRIL